MVEQRFDVKVFFKNEWVSNFDNRINLVGETIEQILNDALKDTELGYLEYSQSNFIIAPSTDISEVLSLDYVLVKERFRTPV